MTLSIVGLSITHTKPSGANRAFIPVAGIVVFFRKNHETKRVTLDAMPKRPSRPRDPNELAFSVYLEAIGEVPPPDPESQKNPAAVALGKLGGAKGGKARAAKLTPEERRESARKAALARWKQ